MNTAETLITKHLDTWTSAIKAKSSAGRGGKKEEFYGIKKLRELILELAVMGKLVPQDPEDEPGSQLLKKLTNERHRLVKEGRLKKEKPPISFTGLDDLRAAKPKEWEWVRLSTVADIVRGGSPRPAGDPRFYDGDIPFLKVGDVTNNRGKFVEGYKYTIKEAGLKKTRYINERTVMLSNSGATLGIPAICEFPTTFNDGIAAFVERSEYVYDEYLYLCLKNLSSWFLNIASRGQGQPNLNTDIIKAAWIPLPPLAEQHRIVAKVDELMALCDQLEQEQTSSLDTHDTLVATLLDALTASTASPEAFAEAWQRIQANFDTLFTTESSIDQLKQTILQLAVMGKVVPQDPKDESASELLKRIAAENANLIKEKKAKKPKAMPSISEKEIPFKISQGWDWCRFDQIINQEYPIAYGVLVPGPHVEGGVPLVRVADLDLISPNPSPEKYISQEVDLKFPRTRVKGGEIFMAVVGSIGKLGIAPASWEGANIARALCRIVPSENVSKEYILMLLQTDFMQERFQDDTRVLAQPTLNISLIRSAHTPVPPLAEQYRIVAKVDELMALCDQLKASLATAQETQLNLADSLVEQAIG